MQCYKHPEAEAVGACTTCGKAVCEACAIDVGGKIQCRDCLAQAHAQPQPQMTLAKDPSTAFLIELVGGFFGFLGLGYIYVGRTQEGVTRLVIWLLYLVLSMCLWTIVFATVIGLICIPVPLVIQVVVPLWSANMLKKSMGAPGL